MTKRELDEMLSQNGGEIVFEDGYSIAAFTGSYYCTYTPDQHVGQGIVCNFEKAVKFYFEHCYASHKAGPFQTEKELEQFFNKPGRKITFNNGSSIERVSENRYILFTPEMWEDGRLIPARCPIRGLDLAFKFYKKNCVVQNTNHDQLKVTAKDIKLVENFITKTTKEMTLEEMQAVVKMVYDTFVHTR